MPLLILLSVLFNLATRPRTHSITRCQVVIKCRTYGQNYKHYRNFVPFSAMYTFSSWFMILFNAYECCTSNSIQTSASTDFCISLAHGCHILQSCQSVMAVDLCEPSKLFLNRTQLISRHSTRTHQPYELCVRIQDTYSLDYTMKSIETVC